jgi:hypothetical protein
MVSLRIGVRETDFGTAVIDGERFVRVKVTDTDSDDFAELTFRLAQFVAFADHLGMVAEAIVDGRELE